MRQRGETQLLRRSYARQSVGDVASHGLATVATFLDGQNPGALMFRLLSSIAMVCVLPVGMSAAQTQRERLQEMLGPDVAGAKVVARRNNDVVAFDLQTMTLRTLASFSSGGQFEGLSRPCWSGDGQQIVFAHGGQAFTIGSDGTNRRRVLANQFRVYEPSFWDNPHTGERCIVFKDRNAKDWYGDGNPGKTFLFQPRRGGQMKIADFPCDAGLSRDGTHLGDAYAGALILDFTAGLANPKAHRLNGGELAADGSMSPDNKYRLMHLMPSRKEFCIRNKSDAAVWKVDAPGDAQWFSPRFSNHPNYCMAALVPGDVPAIVEIDSKKIVRLDGLGAGWSAPHLWLPSGAGIEVEAATDVMIPQTPPSPIADLELTKLAYYKRMVAGAECYTPLLRDLVAMQDEPESLKIVETLEKWGNEKLERSAKGDDVLAAAAAYRELAAKFKGHEIGKFANQLLYARQFQKEIMGAELLQELLALEKRLRPARNGPSHCENHDFLQRNRATVAMMSKVAESVLGNFPDTKAGKTAGEIVGKHRIPEKLQQTPNVLLKVDATLQRVSTVPDAAKIAPETESLVYFVYRVDKVISGQYTEPTIGVVTYGWKNGRATAAAGWKPGLQQRLTLDLFDYHRDLHEKPAGDEAQDPMLTPYWLNQVDRPARLWVDATGGFRVEAQLVATKQGWVRLRLNDGREISIPITKLSLADQQYLGSQGGRAGNQ